MNTATFQSKSNDALQQPQQPQRLDEGDFFLRMDQPSLMELVHEGYLHKRQQQQQTTSQGCVSGTNGCSTKKFTFSNDFMALINQEEDLFDVPSQLPQPSGMQAIQRVLELTTAAADQAVMFGDDNDDNNNNNNEDETRNAITASATAATTIRQRKRNASGERKNHHSQNPQ